MSIYGILILKNKIHLRLLTLTKEGDKFVWAKSYRIPYNQYVTFKNPTYAICRQTINKVTRFDFLEGDLNNPIINLKPYIYNCKVVW